MITNVVSDEIKIIIDNIDSSKHLIVFGPASTGKTYAVRNALSLYSKSINVEYLSGNITPLTLYLALWKTRAANSILVLDDVAKDRAIFDMLKSAMDAAFRTVSYPKLQSASIQQILKDTGFDTNVPTSFDFAGHVIIITDTDLNKPNLHPTWQSLINRAFCISSAPTVTTPTIKLKPAVSSSYKNVFNTTDGQEVLSDLERIINQIKIDGENPNANAAIWKCAQQALIQRIHNQLAI